MTAFAKQPGVLGLSVQSIHELRPDDPRLEAEVRSALERWRDEQMPGSHNAHLFQLERTMGFCISYDDEADSYWPDQAANALPEALVREFLYSDGICRLTDLDPRLYSVHFRLFAIEDTEYLLVCPYRSRAGNIGGLVVICVDHRFRAR